MISPLSFAKAPSLTVDVTLPDLDVAPYHRAYVALWLETPERKAVSTFALWVDNAEWYIELREWGRNAGRRND
ncbi:DUF2271 domain-containing protein, partial [Pseudoalteromonas sp. S4491]|uniref:DUF2271 domain-containing protein n=1 Tax=Pseudoalteromonas sp. S4491 TaxID=579559 RepID=UPI002079043E